MIPCKVIVIYWIAQGKWSCSCWDKVKLSVFFPCKLFKNWEENAKNRKKTSTPKSQAIVLETCCLHHIHIRQYELIIKFQIFEKWSYCLRKDAWKIIWYFTEFSNFSFFSQKFDFSPFYWIINTWIIHLLQHY